MIRLIAMDVVCGLITYKSKLLIAKRPKHKHHGDLWEFPGGKVRNNESKKQALSRELKEELLFQPDIINMKLIGHVSMGKLNLFLVGLPMTAPLIPIEHSALAWVRPDELGQFKLCPSDQKAIIKYGEHIRSLILEQY